MRVRIDLPITYGRQFVLPKLQDLATVNSALRSQKFSPSGKLTISVPNAYANVVLAPYLVAFAKQYPDLQLELRESNQFVDLFSTPIDAAICLGRVENNRLIDKSIQPQARWLCASPDFVALHGSPKRHKI